MAVFRFTADYFAKSLDFPRDRSWRLLEFLDEGWGQLLEIANPHLFKVGNYSLTLRWPFVAVSCLFPCLLVIITIALTRIMLLTTKRQRECGILPNFGQHLLFFYNPAMVIVHSWCVLECIQISRRSEYTLYGNAYRHDHVDMARVVWITFLSNLLSVFMDSILNLLGGAPSREYTFKGRSIVLYHYERYSTLFVIWLLCCCGYDGDAFLYVLVHCSVRLLDHFLACIEDRPVWRRLVVFVEQVCALFMSSVAIVNWMTKSQYPPVLKMLIIVHQLSIMILYTPLMIRLMLQSNRTGNTNAYTCPICQSRAGVTTRSKDHTFSTTELLVQHLETRHYGNGKKCD